MMEFIHYSFQNWDVVIRVIVRFDSICLYITVLNVQRYINQCDIVHYLLSMWQYCYASVWFSWAYTGAAVHCFFIHVLF